MSITKNIIIDENKGIEADTHKVEVVSIEPDKVRALVRSYKAGYESPISEKWYPMTHAEFEAAEATTGHSEFINVAKSKAYVVLDAKVFNPPEPEPEVPAD